MNLPSKILCIGRNYLEHARELGNEVPAEPLVFMKPPSAIVGNGIPIVLPTISAQVEYEGEIGVVIGRRISNVSEDDAAAAIRGIVALNDVTARDLQKKDGQWTRAKGFDTFCPIGEEFTGPRDLGDITVITRVNGTVRQRGNSRDMAFSIPLIVAHLSRIMTLEPGDVIATGTPAGVGRLEPGDVVEVEVVGMSRVSNRVAGSR